jgi:biotin carboxylase
VRLYIVAGKTTDSVTRGFLPAAARLGLDVTVLTDRPADHAPLHDDVVACDVGDYRAIISSVGDAPSAIFSNSDHLQAATALAAAYHGLPGKDWRAALRTKNKALTRRALGGVLAFELRPDDDEPPAGVRFPAVLKPSEGVASEDVVRVANAAELAARTHEIRRRRGTGTLLVEEFLPGELYTLETLGDGHTTHVLGSFHTTLSPPPYFIEERLEAIEPPPEADQILAALNRLGVGFGACHTEFVVHEGVASVIEVNYRLIGDHCDFLLAEALGVPLFEQILGVHLGDPAPAPPPRRGQACVDYVIATETGTLTAAPGPLDGDGLSYLPMRPVGEYHKQTNTNRDYLGAIRAVGPGAQDRIRAFRAAHRWEIGG